MIQRLRDAICAVPGFHQLTGADQIRFFAWVLHGGGMEHLQAADFLVCFNAVDLPSPSNLHRDLRALVDQDHLLRPKQGYKLALPQRLELEAKHGKRKVTVQVLKELEELPPKLSDLGPREYLDEAIKCFRAEAWRAAIVMAWNLAYDHLCQHVMTKKLIEFNAVTATWKKPVTIAKRSDLQDLRESEVITVCRKGTITDGPQDRCLERNLKIRNDAAHPSGAKFSQAQAEAFIMDVVQNVVLNPALPV